MIKKQSEQILPQYNICEQPRPFMQGNPSTSIFPPPSTSSRTSFSMHLKQKTWSAFEFELYNKNFIS